MEELAVKATGSGANDDLNAIRSCELALKRNRGAIACAECRRFVIASYLYYTKANERCLLSIG